MSITPEDNTPSRPATIRDVAALSGVTASTVSRALSTPGRVNFRTRARIEAAAAQLNYVPNAQAKALSSGRTRAVVVLVADITNPFYFDIIRGTQHQLKAAGYTQLLVDTEESDEVEINTLEQMRQTADGVILTASRLSDQALAEAGSKMPLVTINRDVPGAPSVILDTPTATNQALDHLISLGGWCRTGYLVVSLLNRPVFKTVLWLLVLGWFRVKHFRRSPAGVLGRQGSV